MATLHPLTQSGWAVAVNASPDGFMGIATPVPLLRHVSVAPLRPFVPVEPLMSARNAEKMMNFMTMACSNSLLGPRPVTTEAERTRTLGVGAVAKPNVGILRQARGRPRLVTSSANPLALGAVTFLLHDGVSDGVFQHCVALLMRSASTATGSTPLEPLPLSECGCGAAATRYRHLGEASSTAVPPPHNTP
jgi:hypothetical protein